jgi:dUTPase
MLTPDLGVQIISVGVYGTMGLRLGKSSTTIRGLQVYPGVTNEDYTGEIKIMTQAPGIFVAVSPEIKVAQLVILLHVKKGKVLTHTPWRDGGFSSSNHAYWVQQITKDRPEMTLFLNEK